MIDWYFPGFWFFGWIFVVLLLVTVCSRFWRRDVQPSWRQNNKEALAYLKERYAKGEITNEEYEKVKKDIT